MESNGSLRFSAHYEELFPKIYSYIYYRINDRETSEDLTSQTFLKALEYYPQFDPVKASFKTWIYRIAQNILIDHFRTQKSHRELEEAEELGIEDRILETLITQEKYKNLHQALTKLSSVQRKIIFLRLWDELSYAEIAELTGKSEASLKMAFMRALSILRSEAPENILLLTLLIHFQ